MNHYRCDVNREMYSEGLSLHERINARRGRFLAREITIGFNLIAIIFITWHSIRNKNKNKSK